MNQSFVVIGAGPVGLTTALLLNKLGYEVTVYESSAQIQDSTSALYDRCPIGLHERGLLCLETIDPSLRDKVMSSANLVTKKEFTSGSTSISDADAGRTYFTTRRGLTNMLFQLCQKQKIPIKEGNSLLSVDAQRKSVTFCDKVNGGRLVTVDCSSSSRSSPGKRVVSCDGNSSASRCILEHQVSGLNVSSTAWEREFRSIITKVDSSKLPHDLDPSTNYIMNGHTVFCANDAVDKKIWVISLLIDNSSQSAVTKALLSREASEQNIQMLKDFVSKNLPRVMPLLDGYNWSDFFKSRSYQGSIVELSKLNVDEFMVYCGDSAHALLPLENNEGVNVGLEDAHTLYKVILANQADPIASQNILSIYNSQRHKDIEGLVAISHFMNETLKDKVSDQSAKSRYLVYRCESYLKKMGIIENSSMELFSQKTILPYSDIASLFFKRNNRLGPIARLVSKPVDKLASYYTSLKSYLPNFSSIAAVPSTQG